MGVENFASTGIRSTDIPACSESLYRLSYPGPCRSLITHIIYDDRDSSVISFTLDARHWFKISDEFNPMLDNEQHQLTYKNFCTAISKFVE
jgi:hypothetical protein